MTVTLTDSVCGLVGGAPKQRKVYDTECSGFHVSINLSGPATFWLRYVDPATHKRWSLKVGTFHPKLFTTSVARTKATELKWRIANGEDPRSPVIPEPCEQEAPALAMDRRNVLRRQARAQQDRATKDRRNQRERERRLRIHAVLEAVRQLGWDEDCLIPSVDALPETEMT